LIFHYALNDVNVDLNFGCDDVLQYDYDYLDDDFLDGDCVDLYYYN